MRNYAQVEARVLEVTQDRGRRSVSETVSYTYSFNGADYTGTDRGRTRATRSNPRETVVSEMQNTAPYGTVTAWVDPHRPTVSVLDRRFGWPWIGLLFAIAIGGFTVPYCNLPNCSVADLVTGQSWLPKAAFALVWMVSVLPALRAMLVLHGQPIMWMLATLLAAATAVMLMFLALKTYVARQRFT
jgi:hypothetical protein